MDNRIRYRLTFRHVMSVSWSTTRMWGLTLLFFSLPLPCHCTGPQISGIGVGRLETARVADGTPQREVILPSVPERAGLALP